MAKDLVCDMDVDIPTATEQGLTSEYQGQTYYFCGAGCKKAFDRNPEQYVNPPAAPQE
jgi:YHS domain-containing protein